MVLRLKFLWFPILWAGGWCSLYAWDLDQGFPAFLEGHSGWKAAVRSDSTSRLGRRAADQTSPELSLSLKSAGYDDSRGQKQTFPNPELTLWSVPIDTGLTATVPVWDPAVGAQSELDGIEAKVAEASLEEYRDGLFGDYLGSLSAYASALGLTEIRSEAADSFTELLATAERRLKLGAGSVKEVLRAQVAAQQAQTAVDLARHQAELVTATWSAALKTQVASVPQLESAAHWVPFLLKRGVEVGFLFDGTTPDEGPLPEARTPESETWTRKKAIREAELLRQAPLPSLSLYGQVDFNMTPDQTGATTWETILQAGVKIQWNVLTKANSPPQTAWAVRMARDRAALSDDSALDRSQTLEALASDYRSKVSTWTQRLKTRSTAERYAEALKAEFTGGTSTLDSYLQGSQLTTKSREDEWTARWDAVAAALAYLKAAGRSAPEKKP